MRWFFSKRVATCLAAVLFAELLVVPAARASAADKVSIPPIVSPKTRIDPEPVKGDFSSRPPKSHGFVEGESKEIGSARSRDTKSYRNPDGSYMAVFGYGLHYKDSADKWVEADRRFRANDADFVANLSDVIVRVTPAGMRLIDREAGKGIAWLTATAPTVKEDAATYRDEFGLDWSYRLTRAGVKLSATVGERVGAARTYSFPYEAVGGASEPTVDADGNLNGDGFAVPRPIIVGADGKTFSVDGWHVAEGKASFDFDDSALPDAALPYEIDPSTSFYGSSQASGDRGYVKKTGSTYPPSSAATVYTSQFRVQKSLFGSYEVDTGLARWSTSSLPDSATIQWAKVDFSCSIYGDDNNRALTADWYTAWPIDAADWTSTAQTSASGASGWDLTSMGFATVNLVNPSANVSKTGYTGLRFHISGGQPAGQNWLDCFAPDLQVLYNNQPPPTPTLSAPADNAVVPTTTPEFTATAVDPNSEWVYFDFAISTEPDGVGNVVDSGWIWSLNGSGSWTPPSGALADGRTYYWRVKARDQWEDPATSFSAWSVTRSFRVDLALGDRSGRPYDQLGPLSVNLANGNVSLSLSSPSVSAVGGSIGLSYAYNSRRPSLRGLTGAYFNDIDGDRDFDQSENASVVRTDPTVAFNWFAESPYGSVRADNFLVHWEGYVTVPAAGSYKFGTRADDGTRVWVNNALVFDHWVTQAAPAAPQYGTALTLAAGQTVPIDVEYFENRGAAGIELWANGPCGESGAIKDCPVPASWLTQEVTGLPGGWSLSADPEFDLDYTGAAISDNEVVLTDFTGASHVYTWTGSGWAPPQDEEGILTNDASTGLLVLHAEDGYVYSFNADGSLNSVQSALDDRSPAAPSFTWVPLSSSLPQARLTRITDPVSGHYVLLTYGIDGGCPSGSGFTAASSYMLCKIDYGSFGLGVTELYYSNGHLARLVDPGGATADFGYDASGQLTQIRDVLTNDFIASGIITDPTSDTHKTLLTYTSGKVTQITSPLPAAGASRPQRTYEYPTGTTTKVHIAGMSEPLGYARQVTIDSLGRMTEDYDVAGKKATYVYDSADRITRMTDATAIVTATIYDAAGRPTDTYGPGAAAEFGADDRSATAPHSQTFYDEGISGLAAAWWDNPNVANSPKAHTTLSSWPDWGSGSPATLIPTDGFSGRLTGELEAASTGSYTFTADVEASDGVRVLVDDAEVIDRWQTYKANVLADAAKGYWRLGEASGTSAADTSGAGNNGTYVGGPSLGVAGMIGGDTDTAVSFNAASKYVAITPSNPTSLSAPYTVEAWVKPNTTTGILGIFGTRFGGDYSFDLKLMNGNKIHADIGTGSSWLTTAADANFTYAVGDRIHIVYVVTTTDYTIYANGAEVGYGSISGTPLLYNATHTIRIGNSTSTEGFNGTLDEVAVYPDALSPDRVKSHYLASSLSGTTTLTAGPHRILVDYQDPSGPAKLTINWTPPGGSSAAIPMSSLDPRYGLITTTIDADGKKTRGEYANPELGLATASVIDPDALALRSSATHEAAGSGYFRTTARTLPKGVSTTMSYAYWGATETSDNPCTGTVESISQAGMLKMTTAADPDGTGTQQPIQREVRYDAAGRVVAHRVIGDAAWTCTSYDTRGRVTSRVDRTGKATTMNYSTPGVVATSYIDSAGTSRNTTARTDWLGRPLSYTDEHGTTTRATYDQAGRVIDTYRQFAGQADTLLTRSAYDSNTGRLTSLTEYASGSGRTTTFTYDDAGRLNTLSRPPGVTTTNTFDTSRGWLNSITNKRGTTELSPWTYTRNLSANVATEATTGRTRGFTYDGAGRLTTTVEGATTRRYYYDANSNRCSTTAPCNANSALDAYQYDNADRLLVSPFASSYTYDSHGNITAANVTTPSTPGSINQPASFDAGYSLAPQSFPFIVGQNGSASAQYAWSATTPVNRSGTLTGVLAVGGTSSSPMLFDGEAYGTASLSWTRDNHQVNPTFSTSVAALATNSHTVSPNTSGTISANLDWNPTSNSQTWNASVANLGTYDQPITASASGALSASLTWPSGVPNPDLDLYLMDGATVLTSSTAISGNSESISFTVPSSVTYTAKKTYTLQVRAKATGSSFTLSSTWPVTPNLDLELWQGSTKVASSYSTTAKPETVSAAGQPAGTYTWKVISKDYAASYTLTSTHNQLDYANLSLSLKDSTGTTVSSATGSSGSLQLPGHISSSGGQYALVVVDNSPDLGVPSFTMPWSTTTLGDDSASGTIAASSVATKSTTADASGFAQGMLSWTQGTHTVTTTGSPSVGAGSTSSIGFSTNTSGPISASVDWNSSSTAGSWGSSVPNLGAYDRTITASAGGTITATVTWPSQLPNPDLDIYILRAGLEVASNTTIADPGNTASVTYSVPSSVTLANPDSYVLRVRAKATGSTFTLSSTWPVTANLDVELWRGSTLVASSYAATAKPETLSASSQPAAGYTLKIISTDFSASASYSISYSQLDFANLTLRIRNSSGTTVASGSSSSGLLTLQTTLSTGGTYTFETTNNSTDLNVPSYTLSINVPRLHAASARLQIQNASGLPLASQNGGGTLNVTANGLTPGRYYAVLSALTGAGSGTITGSYPGRVPRETISYDGNDHATVIDDGTATITETLDPSGRVLRRRVVDDITGDVLEDVIYGYDSDSDSPAYAMPYGGGAVTTYVSGPGGLVVVDTAGTPTYPIQNGHGDVVGTVDGSGNFTAAPPLDEFGVGTAPANRLGWLGSRERFFTGGTLRLIRMGVRVYDPALGRFLAVDPVEGGSFNDYEYVGQDPVNSIDLDGSRKRVIGPNQGRYCNRQKKKCALAFAASRLAEVMASRLGRKFGWDKDQKNAFRHVYWMGLTTIWTKDADFALGLGFAHEEDTDPASGEGPGSYDWMVDLINNYVGAYLGEVALRRGGSLAKQMGNLMRWAIRSVQKGCTTICAVI